MGLLYNVFSRFITIHARDRVNLINYRVERDAYLAVYRIRYRYKDLHGTMTLTDNDLYHADVEGAWAALEHAIKTAVRKRHPDFEQS